MSIERKILNKALRPPLPSVPKRKEVRRNYKIGGEEVKQNLTIDTIEPETQKPRADSTPKGFMSSSTSVSSNDTDTDTNADTPIQSNGLTAVDNNTVLMPVSSILQRQSTPIQHTELSPMSRGDDDTVASIATVQSPVNVSLPRVELNTSVKRALKNGETSLGPSEATENPHVNIYYNILGADSAALAHLKPEYNIHNERN